MDTNYVTLLTGTGTAGVATLRISGPAVDGFCKTHLSRRPPAGRCTYADLHDAGATIDDVVAVRVTPNTVDLSLHGGAWVIESALRLAEQAGFVRRDYASLHPGELLPELDDAADTVLTGIEQQVHVSLPLARTPEATRLLLAQPAAWQKMLAADRPEELQRALDDRTMSAMLTPPRVALVGAANVGKSSLANRLTGEKSSIVADVPGTTRDWVGTPANMNGLLIELIDTPGLRQTNDPIEQAAIDAARPAVASAELVIEVVDAAEYSAGASTVTEETSAGLVDPNRGSSTASTETGRPLPFGVRPHMLIVSRVDLVNESVQINTSAEEDVLFTSCLTGRGLAELRARVVRFFGCDDMTLPHARAWTPGQRELLRSRLS